MIIRTTPRYRWVQKQQATFSPCDYVEEQTANVICDSAACMAQLPAPHLLMGAETAAQVIYEAIVEKRPIVIFGDYDVDGTTASAMLKLFFDKLKIAADVYIPERLVEGYGLNPIGLRNIREKNPSAHRILVITVDNGIAAVDACEAAKSLGIDVIITDHHDLPPVLPNAKVIVNPKQPGCQFPYRMLAGAGVAFYVMAALRALLRDKGFAGAAEINLKSYLDLVALGTIADLAPLDGVNHQLCKVGLEVMLKHVLTNKRPGIAQLLKLAGWKPDAGAIDASDVGFKIGPRLNAAGRLGNALATVNLLRCENEAEALELAQLLHNENAERQIIEKSITSEAFEQIIQQLRDQPLQTQQLQAAKQTEATLNVTTADPMPREKSPSAFVLYNPNWHTGVVGIVASRVMEKYYRPTLVLGSIDGVAKGSGRSTHAFNLFEALSPFRPELRAFGGHFHAVGLSLDEQKIPLLREFLVAQANGIPTSEAQRQLNLDGYATLETLSSDLLESLRAFEPFGQGNPRPKWLLQNLSVQQVKRVGKAANSPHAKMIVSSQQSQAEVIAFGLAEELLLEHANAGKTVDLVVEARIQQFMGRRKPELRLIDFHTHHLG